MASVAETELIHHHLHGHPEIMMVVMHPVVSLGAKLTNAIKATKKKHS